jgi:hypothetical protein
MFTLTAWNMIAWDNETYIEQFKNSDAYSMYFMVFFGQPTPPSPNAFFNTQPKDLQFDLAVYTIWTFSYKAPVLPEDRHVRVVEGLDNWYIGAQGMRLRNQRAWVNESQVVDDTQVEQGLLIQKWPLMDDWEVLRRHEHLRERLNEQIKEMDALHVEEVTWQFGMTAAEREAMESEIDPSEEGDSAEESVSK